MKRVVDVCCTAADVGGMFVFLVDRTLKALSLQVVMAACESFQRVMFFVAPTEMQTHVFLDLT